MIVEYVELPCIFKKKKKKKRKVKDISYVPGSLVVEKKKQKGKKKKHKRPEKRERTRQLHEKKNTPEISLKTAF